MKYKITLTIWLDANDDEDAYAIVDHALEEPGDLRIKAWHFDAVETDQ